MEATSVAATAERRQAASSTEVAHLGRLNVVCVGARAEGSLPPTLWLETLFALPGIGHLDLHLLGPEVVIPRLPTTQTPPDTGARGPDNRSRKGSRAKLKLYLGGRTVELSWTRAMLGTVGEVNCTTESSSATQEKSAKNGEETAETAEVAVAAVEAERAVAKADAFVLFNPGLGHPHLRQGWESATERLLRSGLPVIVTCHGPIDMERDMKQLNAVGEKCCADWGESRGVIKLPKKNVFGSLRSSEDPLASAAGAGLVSPNWGVFVLGDRRRDRKCLD